MMLFLFLMHSFICFANRPHDMVLSVDESGMPILTPAALAIDLPTAKSIALHGIQASCQASITGGFVSEALGRPCYYGSQQTDQLNLQAMFAASQSDSPPVDYYIYCSSAPIQNPPLILHSYVQMLRVLADMNAWRTVQQRKYAELVDRVQSATTIEAVQAMGWERSPG
ncbi:hypothetical protein [Chromobacterium vaccinii]|uniref:hypothetical protein n=1 Tax=Chromobacterium vaccinii TaxID=1108595 RepID=UPI000E20A123|nr:hypothetical protein [Chromobacterium vaccinii]